MPLQRSLRRKCNALKRKVRKLSEQNGSLLFRNRLLDALITTFAGLRITVQASLVDRLQTSGNDTGEQVQQLELQGADTDLGPVEAPQNAAELLQAVPCEDVDRISPRDEPLAYFKLLLSRPPAAEAATLTSEGLAQMARDMILQASVLSAQGKLLPVQPSSSEQNLHEVVTRYMHMLMSLLVQGRPHVIAGMLLYNLSNMCVEPEQMVQGHAARLSELPAALGLSQQQLQDISTGSALFADLMSAILDERRQLQAASGTSVSSSSCGTTLASRSESLKAQQRDTARLQVLLQKEYVITAMTAAFVAGCLSLPQLASALTLSWPYPLRIPVLGQMIARYNEQQQQQQQ